jgi:flagellar hook-basal body complex protein FliE
MASPAENITSVITAYNRAVRGDSPAVESSAGESGDAFADLVKGAIREAINIQERSESLSIKGISDQADLNQVVTAVAEAETTLQTVVAVRDKVLEAYREIIRMPI